MESISGADYERHSGKKKKKAAACSMKQVFSFYAVNLSLTTTFLIASRLRGDACNL
jgi:hypothetical protein